MPFHYEEETSVGILHFCHKFIAKVDNGEIDINHHREDEDGRNAIPVRK